MAIAQLQGKQITLLFRNSVSGIPWSGQTLNVWFEAHLKALWNRSPGTQSKQAYIC